MEFYSSIVPTQEASVEKFPESTRFRELPHSLSLTLVIDMVRYLLRSLYAMFVMQKVRYPIRSLATGIPDISVGDLGVPIHPDSELISHSFECSPPLLIQFEGTILLQKNENIIFSAQIVVTVFQPVLIRRTPFTRLEIVRNQCLPCGQSCAHGGRDK